MEWKKVKVSAGSKLFKNHRFTFMHKGTNYRIEVDEFSDGACTGHAEHSTDKNSVIESVSAPSLDQTLQMVIAKIESRG